MSLFTSIIYGFVSGITEIFPVSSQGHQALMRHLFGVDSRVPLQELLVHIAVFLALIIGCSDAIRVLMREQRALASRRIKSRYTDSKSRYELRLLKSASFLLLIGLCFYISTVKFEGKVLAIIAFWLVNAFFLFLADHMPRGNRDARTMSSLDGIVMGVIGAASVFPGVSRIGIITTYAIARGVDDESAVNWSLLLSIPALLFYILFDLFSLLTYGAGIHSFSEMIGCVLSGAVAFAGAYLGISLLKLVLHQSGLSKFAYYSIGAAMFTFAIYLIA